MNDALAVTDALHRVQDQIASACARAGRDPSSVRLIAVSKLQPITAIEEAYAAGQRDFGENYVQELVGKADALRHLAGARFRLIGHLQRNKAKDIVRVRCAVDTVDSVRLAEALSSRAVSDGVQVEILLQVNVAGESQKSGVSPRDLPELVERVRGLPGLTLDGLMTIPPITDDPNDSRIHFRALRSLAEQLQLTTLSMGMSADLEAAVEEGSTMVRVGTAIFGSRG